MFRHLIVAGMGTYECRIHIFETGIKVYYFTIDIVQEGKLLDRIRSHQTEDYFKLITETMSVHVRRFYREYANS